jgi:hypothetical protein
VLICDSVKEEIEVPVIEKKQEKSEPFKNSQSLSNAANSRISRVNRFS